MLFPLMLILGMSFGYMINTSQTSANSTCSFTYCSAGQCVSNKNATSCTSPDGSPPCTDQTNCMDDPAETD